KDDIFRYMPGQSGAEVLLSTGNSFGAPRSWTGAGYGSAPNGWYVGDVDGDGKDDIFRYIPSHL
ncbi:MAG: FG-GAP-like repeat-containing protein, partial [Planctomycetota bacterium]